MKKKDFSQKYSSVSLKFYQNKFLYFFYSNKIFFKKFIFVLNENFKDDF